MCFQVTLEDMDLVLQDINLNSTRAKLLTLQAKERLQQLEQSFEKSSVNSAIISAYDHMMDSDRRLPKVLGKLDIAIKRFDIEKIISEKEEIRRDFLVFQKELLQRRVGEVRTEARRRRDHIRSLKTSLQQEDERRRCAEDVFYWFDNYAVTLDPRNPVLFLQPFLLFPKQREYISSLEECVYTTQEWLLAEKSRDEGISWATMCWFTYRFLFPEGDGSSQFLIASMKQPDVDQLGNPSTLMEKIRVQLRFLPDWMLPKDWDWKKHCNHMRIVNPANGSSITGSTANPDTGRGGRYTAIAIDEAASVEKDEASITAASQSTNSIIVISTPKGKQNEFYRLRHGGDIRVCSFHWKHNPFKDERWYRYQKLKLTPEMLAQEVDINYEASQSGRVFPEWDETKHVITWREFVREVPGSYNQEDLNPHIPATWNLMRVHDWGSTGDEMTDHANITTWLATAPEGCYTKSGVDISGSVFVYRCLIMPAHSTIRQTAVKVTELESEFVEGDRMFKQLMSHEAASARDTYNKEHNFSYTAWQTKLDQGIAQLRDYLELEKGTHPFRPQFETAPRLYFISDDDEAECYFDGFSQTWKCRPALTQAGLHRARYEMETYHWDESGKKPVKFMDDFVDTLRGAAIEFPPKVPRNLSEIFEESLPEALKAATIQNTEDELERGVAYLSRQEFIRAMPRTGGSRWQRLTQRRRY